MKKNLSIALRSTQAQNTDSENISLLPYSAPELLVYNHAKITMGGVKPTGNDFVEAFPNFTNYRVS